MNKILSALFLSISVCSYSQQFTSASVLAHNDYLQNTPFHTAYQHEVGYIEVDIFLQKGKLLVAHTSQEIDNSRTLEMLYLKPLEQAIQNNKGYAYLDKNKSLALMIDLKTDGALTLTSLNKLLTKYPTLTSCKTLRFIISGNMPNPITWSQYPAFIFFDGRPDIEYTPEQLNRVAFISDNFNRYSLWNGKGKMTKQDLNKVMNIINTVHNQGKKIRFWSAPDFKNAWMTFMQLKVDILNTDQVESLAQYLQEIPNLTYTHDEPHQVYVPKNIFKTNKPKNIILLIGDGMGLTQVYGGYTANRGALNIFNISTIGLSITTAADHYITDSAAGATAMATGQKTNNRYVGVDTLGRPLASITDDLNTKGYQTILISSGDITDATPAAFYSHQSERSMSEAIANDMLHSNIDIIIGAGLSPFIKRKDSTNLFDKLQNKGYMISTNLAVLDTIAMNRFIVLNESAGKRKLDSRGSFLVNAFHASLRSQQKEEIPFFMMAEGAQIDWGGHANELNYVISEMLDFDQLVGAALKFADDNQETLVIVTADHETGGLALTGGDIAKGSIEGSFSTVDHTAVIVPVFAYGPGAINFQGVFQNTEIYHKIMNLVFK